MAQQKRGKINKRLAHALLILLLSIAIIQTIQVTHCQNENTPSNNQWALNFQIQTGQNATTNAFTPFYQIQLSANVTYRNATQPDILVTFKVQGPSNSPNQINITRIETTNANGETECALRLPAEGQNTDSLIGSWQATATIQTSNGTLQKTLTFTTQWNLEITSIN